jgi:hypothetical protein
MKTKKHDGNKAGASPSNGAPGKDSSQRETKPVKQSGKSEQGREARAPAFDDLDEMRKDIDALGDILGADDGRPIP